MDGLLLLGLLLFACWCIKSMGMNPVGAAGKVGWSMLSKLLFKR